MVDNGQYNKKFVNSTLLAAIDNPQIRSAAVSGAAEALFMAPEKCIHRGYYYSSTGLHSVESDYFN